MSLHKVTEWVFVFMGHFHHCRPFLFLGPYYLEQFSFPLMETPFFFFVTLRQSAAIQSWGT
jgi:hypothetical protein